MRPLITFILFTSSLAATGCQKFTPMANAPTGEKVWITSQDGSEVFFCWTDTPKEEGGRRPVTCKRARFVGHD